MLEDFSFRARVKSTVAVAFFAGLAGCGGGGSDLPAVSAAPGAATSTGVAPLPAPVAVATVPPPVAAPAPATPATGTTAVGDFSCGLNGAAGIEAEVLQRVNALRAAGAVCGATPYAATGPLAWNAALLLAAKGHSADMAQKNYFSHTSQDGRNAGQRVTAAGYTWSSYGENIAAGQASVEQVMSGWANSPGHCQNLMNPSFKDVAVACVRNDAADYRLYWTMNLGRSR